MCRDARGSGLHNSVKAVGTRAEDAMEHASYAHHLGLVSGLAE